MLKVNEYGERQAKENGKNLCFKGWETLVILFIYEIFSFRGIDLYIFFLYLCPVGTLLACYSVPRQVEDEYENET